MAVPLASAITVPVVDPTDATLVLLLVHVPPANVFVSVVLVPAHNVVLPEMAAGRAFTVMAFTATQPVVSM